MTEAHTMDAVLALCEGLPKQSFAPGMVLIEEGPSSGKLFILVDGDIEILKGDIRVAIVSEPGAVFGEIAALLGLGHSATVRALTPITAYRIETAGSFLQQRPDIMFHVARILARRLVDATTYLSDIKRQYSDRDDHLGMVDEVLEALVNQQQPHVAVESTRESDPRL